MQSQSSPYVQYAQENRSPKEVARLMGCTEKTAREGLRSARELMSEADGRRARVEQVFDDLYKAGVPAIRAAATLGISVKASKKGLRRAQLRAEALTPVVGRQMMLGVLARDANAWHSVDMDRMHLTGFARSDSPSRVRHREA